MNNTETENHIKILQEAALSHLAHAAILDNCVYLLRHRQRQAWRDQDPSHRLLMEEERKKPFLERGENYKAGVSIDMSILRHEIIYRPFIGVSQEKANEIYTDAVAALDTDTAILLDEYNKLMKING